MDKKKNQLGMNPATASGRLLKDLLFDFAIKSGHACHRCDKPLIRETFSVEHIIPWLDSEDPVKLFFDINNIAYSHLGCNIIAVRRVKTKAPHGTKAKYQSGCRCDLCRGATAADFRKRYTTEKRRIKYAKEKSKYSGVV